MHQSPDHLKIADNLQAKIKTLHASIWEKRADWQLVERWLDQFSEDPDLAHDEQIQSLFLLSNFMYFGTNEVRALLRSLYRDMFRSRLARDVRDANGGTLDQHVIAAKMNDEINSTRFVALGNPSESSAMLLYFFRQENALSKEIFINASEVFDLNASGSKIQGSIKSPSIKHYVFIDDLCGSGDQGLEYSKQTVGPLKAANKDAKVYYFSLFGLKEGIDRIRREGDFDVVNSVVELDESFQAFSETSRVFSKPEVPFDKNFAEEICLKYGERLWRDYPLGFQNGQMLIGFSHNTPDNCLPIFWADEAFDASWVPVFKRYPKVYTA